MIPSQAASLPNICCFCCNYLRTGQGDAIFTAQCRHEFHLHCILNKSWHGSLRCPICGAAWDKDSVPFLVPPPQPNNLGGFPSFVPFQFQQKSSSTSHANSSGFLNPFLQHPSGALNLFPPQFQDPHEPASYSDDEPLLSTSPTQSSGSQNVTIRTHTETPAISAAESRPQFPVLVSIRAPALEDLDGHGRTPIDLVTVLDVSGSMTGQKLDLVKRAVKFVIQNLGDSDRLSIVAFSTTARRLFPLKRMSVEGRESANLAVESLRADGGTDIAKGLNTGSRVLEGRKERNPVASIMLLSDGQDNYCNTPSQMLNKLPTLVLSSDRQHEIPVHTFGFGNDHDANVMHAISDASGGSFSYIESVGMIQDSFALCIGGLLSVVSQELCLTVRSASSGVKIVSIPSGRHVSQISDEGQQGVVDVGNMYAEEEKQFLVYLLVPQSSSSETKTSLLDVSCMYRDLASNILLQVSGERIEILRPEVCSPAEKAVSLEVDRQRNRVSVVEAIAEAKGLAEMGNIESARAILTQRREALLTTPAAQAGDGLSRLLETELREITIRMSTKESYAHTGRAFALAGMSSHLQQRATARGDTDTSCLSSGYGASRSFGGSSGFGATGRGGTDTSYPSAGFGASMAFGGGSSSFRFSSGGPSAFGCSSGGSAAFGAAGSLFSAGPTFGASAAAAGGGSRDAPAMFGAPVGAYETPAMLRMVEKSKNLGLQPEQ